MARGQRRSDEELLDTIESDIVELTSRKEKLEEKIKELEQKKSDIIEGKRLKQADELLDIISSAGMSIDDIKDLLQNNKQQAV